MSEVLPESDVNTLDGFSAALAAAAGVPAEPEATQEESAPEGQPRDDSGRFAPAAQVAEVPEEGAAPPAPEEETPDPYAWVPEEHRADFDRIVRENQEAQSLIGRQGNELGDLRSRLDRLEQPQAQQAPPPVPGAPNEEIEALEDYIDANGGAQAFRWAAENREDLIEPALDAWVRAAADDPEDLSRAVATRARYEAALAAQRFAPQAQPAAEPTWEDNLPEALSVLQAERKDFDGIKGHLGAALEDEATPLSVKKMVMNTDPETQLDGMRVLAQYARDRALAQATAEAQQGRTDQVTAARTAAQVATGSLRPSAPEGQPATKEGVGEDGLTDFQRRILKADGISSVLDHIES